MILPGEGVTSFESKRVAFLKAIASETGMPERNVHIWLVEVADKAEGVAVRFFVLVDSHSKAVEVQKKFRTATFGMDVGMKLLAAHVSLHPVHLVHIGKPKLEPALGSDWSSAAYPPGWVDPNNLALKRNVTYVYEIRPHPRSVCAIILAFKVH